MAKADKFPRLFNLVMLLLNSSAPLSLDEIVRRIGGFPESPVAQRQAFERIKKELRDLGIPIQTRPLAGEEQYGYLIDKSEMVIPDLRLTSAEASALAAASAMVRFGTGERNSALSKLGCVIEGTDAAVAAIPSESALYPLFEAIGTGSSVNFRYRGRDRTLDLYGVSLRWGNWYALGREHQSGQEKTFLVSLMESVSLGGPSRSSKPEGYDLSSRLPRRRWEIGSGESVVAVVGFSAEAAMLIASENSAGDDLFHDGDGEVQLRLSVSDEDSFFDWILTFFDKARLIGPELLVERFVEDLRRIGGGRMDDSTRDSIAGFARTAFESGVPEVPLAETPERVPTASGDRAGELRSAVSMYETLTRILPWLARRKTTTVKEISHSFAISEPSAVRLLEMAACCGVPPYTPDSLLEIIVEDDGTVTSHLDMEVISAPRSLDTLEAMVLATIASVALEIPGIDPEGHLSSALGKLTSSLGKFRIGLHDVDIDMEEPYFLGDLRFCANDMRAAEISYYSVSSERLSTREVDPYIVFMESGQWYLRAFCHLSNEIRHFSIARVVSCVPSQRRFSIPDSERAWSLSGSSPPAYSGTGESVVLAVDPSLRWRVESLAASTRFLGTVSGLDVFSFETASTKWLARLLLRLGETAAVILPEKLSSLKSDAADSLLALYGEFR